MTNIPAQEQTARQSQAAPGRAAVRPRLRTSRRYWACLLLLAASAGGLKWAATRFGVFIRKEAVPLKLALQRFDAYRLGPRYELNKALTDKLDAPSDDMLESLRTRDYLQVFLTDTQKRADDPTRVALLFVTYYTGQPDMVPHVPDECYTAGGYDPLGAASATVQVPGSGAVDDQVPVRIVEFQRGRRGAWGGEPADVPTVLYFFHVNGAYTTTRDGVRKCLSNPLQRYAYYAKIEVTFTNGSLVRAGKEASLAALGPLLERVMPVLLTDHFDLDKFAPANVAPVRAQQ